MKNVKILNLEQTLEYYNENAKEFVEATKDVIFNDMQQSFLKYLPKGAHILDFGCGSGRDSKAFIEAGYQVTAIDGSTELCKLASDYIGQPVNQMLFQELDEHNVYEGIWACSSILHLDRTTLHEVLQRMIRALKETGYIYTSFKYGDWQGVRNGRYFNFMTEQSFDELIQDLTQIKVVEYRITGDVRSGREGETWLNVILKKNV